MYRPEKEEKERKHFTAGGNLVTDYPGDVSNDTVGLETIKIHWNSVVSTPGTKWMGRDISNRLFRIHANPHQKHPPLYIIECKISDTVEVTVAVVR